MPKTKLNLDNYKPLRDVVFENLRSAILEGKLKSGQRLMEVQLAEQLGVSRTPVREAIRKLELEGLVVMLPRKGAYVANISVKDLMDVLEIRASLEGLGASLAAERRNDEDIKNLEELEVEFEEAVRTQNIDMLLKKDIEFHECIFKAANNKKLEKIKINTSEIHSVLQEIFAEEQAEILKAEPIETANSEDMDKTKIENGLQNIVNIIIEKENWTRNELLNVIQNKGMMLSSTIDEINEWSNEEFGDFLVEEDDDVYLVNKDVVSLIKK